MALFDKAKNFYDNLNIGEDILGLGLSSRDRMLLDAGILKDKDVKRAREKSKVQGLLNMALSYAMQPKNKGYGSPLPYLATAAKTGLDAAQKPYDNLGQLAELREKVKAIKLNDEMEKARANLFTQADPITRTVMSPVPDQRLMSADGVQQAPSFKVGNPEEITTTFPRELNKKNLQEFAMLYPDKAKPIYDIAKIEAEIGKLNYETQNPEQFRPATQEEIEAYGGDPRKGGQVNLRTGEFKPIGASLVNVDLSDSGKKTINETLYGEYSNQFKTSKQASSNFANYAAALKLLPHIGQTGVGTEAFRAIDKMLIALNMEPKRYSEEELASGEVFESIGNKLAIAQRPAASGVMTDNDFRVFQTMVNDLGKSKKANEDILKMLSLISERSANLSKKMLQYKMGMTSRLTDENGEFIAKTKNELDEGLFLLQQEYQEETGRLMLELFPDRGFSGAVEGVESMEEIG